MSGLIERDRPMVIDHDGANEPPVFGTDPATELVYLLHGFGGPPLLLRRMWRSLRRAGYPVRYWRYPSLRKPIPVHADRLRSDVAATIATNRYTAVHFVTYSLGGIVVRWMFRDESPGPQGRIVMVAPPNGGSRVARVSSMVFRGLCPVLREISDHRRSLVNHLGEVIKSEVGVIAGRGDWVVRHRNTHLREQTDHLLLRAGHLRLPLTQACADQASHFIRHGRFAHPER